MRRILSLESDTGESKVSSVTPLSLNLSPLPCKYQNTTPTKMLQAVTEVTNISLASPVPN